MSKKYKGIKINGKIMDEHRHIMQTHLGRILGYNEVVHHVNGDSKDNRLENLKVMSRKEHTVLHIAKPNAYMFIKCKKCDKSIKISIKKYIRDKNNGKHNVFCSHTCRGKYYNVGCITPINSNIINIIKQEYNKGLSGYKIAKKYNLNSATVYNNIKKLKL